MDHCVQFFGVFLPLSFFKTETSTKPGSEWFDGRYDLAAYWSVLVLRDGVTHYFLLLRCHRVATNMILSLYCRKLDLVYYFLPRSAPFPRSHRQFRIPRHYYGC